MSLSERMEAAEPFFRLAREVINPVDGERPWHADSKDWMVVFSFAGHSLTLGDLRRAAGQDSSAGDAGAAMRHTLSVQETDKSARAEGVAALQQAAEWVLVPREPKPEMVAAWWRVKNGHHFHGEPPPTDTSDYAAYRAMIAAAPLPQQTALVEEKGLVPHEPAACGASAPSDAPRSDGGEGE